MQITDEMVEAAQKAFDNRRLSHNEMDGDDFRPAFRAALRAALAPEPEAPDRGGHWEDDGKVWVGPVKGGQEPVATLSVFESAMCNGRKVGRILGWDSLLKGLPLGEHPLYTSPPQGQREGERK